MAGSRIKGITVEIDGRVDGLEKALRSVNQTIKTTQSQLKDVERLLKLDSSHTELLSQKQALLKEKIGATKEKLDALKTAQEQAKQQMESGDLDKDKYDALQREIIETEQEMKNLAREAAEANTVLNKMDSVGKTLENVGGKMTAVGSSLTRNVTAPIVALGTVAVKTTTDFDASMQDNLSGQITILKSALQELAIQIGDALMPTIRKIVEKIQEFVLKLQSMDEGTRNTILKIAAFAAAIGPALLVVGKLTTGVGKRQRQVATLIAQNNFLECHYFI